MLPKGYRKDIALVRFTLCRSINTFSFSLQDTVGNRWYQYVGELILLYRQKHAGAILKIGLWDISFFPDLFIVVIFSLLLAYTCAHIHTEDHAQHTVYPALPFLLSLVERTKLKTAVRNRWCNYIRYSLHYSCCFCVQYLTMYKSFCGNILWSHSEKLIEWQYSTHVPLCIP